MIQMGPWSQAESNRTRGILNCTNRGGAQRFMPAGGVWLLGWWSDDIFPYEKESAIQRYAVLYISHIKRHAIAIVLQYYGPAKTFNTNGGLTFLRNFRNPAADNHHSGFLTSINHPHFTERCRTSILCSYPQQGR